MKLGALAESITVSGTSPVVDVASTGSSTQLTRETLELIPSTRNGLASLMAQAPGARGVLDVGGSNFAAIPSYSAYGQVGQQWNTVDGVFAANPASGGAGNYFDYTSFEETSVQTIGKSAAVPVRGVQIDAIVKSGGNDFHGNAFYSGTFESFQGDNLDAALQAKGLEGANKIEKRYDISAELGGRIVRNKLWFFGSLRDRQDVTDIPGVFQDDPKTIQAVREQGQTFETIKISYQASGGNRFIAFAQHAAKRELAGSVDVYTPWSTRRLGVIPTGTRKVQWQGVKSNLVASLQWGYYERYFNVPRMIGILRPYSAYSVAITRPIPGADGVVPADARYGTITYYEYPTQFVGAQFDKSTRTSPPEQLDQSFSTIELATTKRLSHHWQVMASYSATKKNIVPAAENASFDPNAEINRTDRTWEQILRVSGAYMFPYGLTASANYESISGDPQAPQALFTGGRTITSIVLNTAPIGTIRLPTSNHLDLRLEKNFSMLGGHQLRARLNVYNSLNANTVTAQTVRLGANYLRPTAILPPRIFEVGLSYAF